MLSVELDDDLLGAINTLIEFHKQVEKYRPLIAKKIFEVNKNFFAFFSLVGVLEEEEESLIRAASLNLKNPDLEFSKSCFLFLIKLIKNNEQILMKWFDLIIENLFESVTDRLHSDIISFQAKIFQIIFEQFDHSEVQFDKFFAERFPGNILDFVSIFESNGLNKNVEEFDSFLENEQFLYQ